MSGRGRGGWRFRRDVEAVESVVHHVREGDLATRRLSFARAEVSEADVAAVARALRDGEVWVEL